MAIIFTDNFTVASDTPLQEYPSAATPDYALNLGTTNTIVSAANDRVQNNFGLITAWRIIDAAVASGMIDQEISFDGWISTDASSPLVRMSAAGQNYYEGFAYGGNVEIYRYDDGSYTLLAGESRSISVGAGNLKFKATGQSPVHMEFVAAGTAAVTYDDNSGSRKQSGPPGFDLYYTAPYVDNITIDDLAAAAALTIQEPPLWQPPRMYFYL
jgi:hypothetical protein